MWTPFYLFSLKTDQKRPVVSLSGFIEPILVTFDFPDRKLLR